MPASGNKLSHRPPEGSTPKSSSPIALDQEEFRQHLRRLAVSAVQVPRDHAGAFHTQVFERYEPEGAFAPTDLFGSFTSTKTSRQSGAKTAGGGQEYQRREHRAC